MTGRRRSTLLLAITLLIAAPATAQQWKYFFGTNWTRWQASSGIRGHIADCRTRHCDELDFDRGNFDASIGYRLGAERLITNGAIGRIDGGGDLSILFTEYNLSQRDFVMFNAALFVALAKQLGPVEVSLRPGAGASLTNDGRMRGVVSVELASDLSLASGDKLRLSWRESQFGGPGLRDISVMLVSDSSHRPGAPGEWEYAMYWGVTHPTSGLSLSRSPLSRHTLQYRRADRPHRIGFAFTTTAHESLLRSDFIGTPGNQRGNSIRGYALILQRETRRGGVILRPGVSVEVSDWTDSHGLLIRDGEPVDAGFGEAFAVRGEAEVPLGSRLSLRLAAEQLYWRRLHFGETRLLFGTAVRIR